MKKVQTGQVIEFYSNSCLVKTKLGTFACLAIKNVVVGDYVELEIIQDSKRPQGKIIAIKIRKSELSKREGNKNKLFAANISHVGIIVTPSPKTSYEFIDKWILKSKLSNIIPFLINNKIDIESGAEYQNKINTYRNINLEVIDSSAKYEHNIDGLVNFLKWASQFLKREKCSFCWKLRGR